MKFNQIALVSCSLILMASCVSLKKYRTAQQNYAELDKTYKILQVDDADCRANRMADEANMESLRNLLTNYKTMANDYKNNNTEMLGRLKDMSVISSTQAESIKKSMDNIGVKDQYIKELQKAVNRKDSMNLALVINLKSALGDINDKDINIKVDKGVVYVDISDKLLFNSGRYNVTENAKEVLSKVAKVLAAQPQIEFLVEGNTDSMPYADGVLVDNWDLSVKRATSVVRILQNQYHIAPARMTAAGRSQYVPANDNDTKEGRAENRRTRIVILPQLDQFFKLLEKPSN